MLIGWRLFCEFEKFVEFWIIYNIIFEDVNYVYVYMFGSFEILLMKYVCL